MQGASISAAVIVAALLAGCASYHAEPLPQTPDLREQIPGIGETPISMTQAAGLAVLDSPMLKAERAKRNVAAAQAFQAGLLPNPQITAGIDHPTTQGQGLVNGYNFGLNFDLLALITHSASSASAEATAKQARLDVLWQEWQTSIRAQTLFAAATTERARIAALSSSLIDSKITDAAVDAALSRQDLAPDQADALLTPRSELGSQLLTARQNEAAALSDLKALLGLTPQATLNFQYSGAPHIPTDKQIERALETLPTRRPDLLALQQGYEAQEENVFKAVLSQFPNIQVGFARASDTSDVHTNSFGVTLDLPIFDQGQGRVAIERATRDQLRKEYQARIDQTQADAWKLWHESQAIQARLTNLSASIPVLKKHALAARQAANSGDIDPVLAAQLQQTWLARQSEFFDLQSALWSDALSLEATLCLPASSAPGKDRPS